jgi:hypothetical protein
MISDPRINGGKWWPGIWWSKLSYQFTHMVILCGHTHLRNRYAQMRTHVELTVVMASGIEGMLEVQLTAFCSELRGENYMLVHGPGTGLVKKDILWK